MGKPWADGPYPLIATPKAKLEDGLKPDVVKFATEMVQAHNIFIRSLNCMTLQAANVTEPQDIQDFMLYAKTWVRNLHSHHSTEEMVLFPMLGEETGIKGIMDANIVQHEVFNPAIDSFSDYVEAVLKDNSSYDSQKFLAHIDDFASNLTTHLGDEINTLLNLNQYEIDLVKCQNRTTEHAVKSLKKDYDIGFAMTHSDSTFEGGIHKNDWPPIPWYVCILFRWVYVPRGKRLWRFSPCDSYFQPKELEFA